MTLPDDLLIERERVDVVHNLKKYLDIVFFLKMGLPLPMLSFIFGLFKQTIFYNK